MENVKYDWDLRKKVPMVPKGKRESRREEKPIIISNVMGIGIAANVRLMSTFGEVPKEPVIKGSNASTKAAWDHINHDHLELVLEAKNANYRIKKVEK